MEIETYHNKCPCINCLVLPKCRHRVYWLDDLKCELLNFYLDDSYTPEERINKREIAKTILVYRRGLK